MSHTTLAGWKQNIGIQLSTTVPTVSLESGITYADIYLSRNGGWTPDNPGAPTDLGAPASGATDAQVVASLLSEITASQYEFRATVMVPVTLRLYANLTPNLDDGQVRDAVAAQVRAYVTKVSEGLSISLDPTILTYTSIASESVGVTTPEQRALYNTGVGLTPRPILSQSLHCIRFRFSVNDTWNFSNVYVEPNGEIRAIIVKYMNTTFSTLDPTMAVRIIVTIDPYTGSILTGVKN